MTRSRLYGGTIRHTRLRPVTHSFRYRVWYGLFDIDEIDEGTPRRRFFSVDRFNLVSFFRSDHGPCDGSALRPWANRVLGEAGVDLDGGRIAILAFPRILGYVFDPISIWFCWDGENRLRAVIHEVRNTFGDRHCYVVPLPHGAAPHEVDKALHVSPFMDMDQTYRFTLTEPRQHLTVSIVQRDAGGDILRAGMSLSRAEFTVRNLLVFFVTHPLVTSKAIAAIHWQALRLLAKGLRIHRRPEPVTPPFTVVRRETA